MGFVGYKEASVSIDFRSRNKRIQSEITMGLHPAIVYKRDGSAVFVVGSVK